MDGYEATRQIRANPDLKSVPIIAVTSCALAGDEGKALAAGCSAYVTKAVQSAGFARESARILGGRRRHGHREDPVHLVHAPDRVARDAWLFCRRGGLCRAIHNNKLIGERSTAKCRALPAISASARASRNYGDQLSGDDQEMLSVARSLVADPRLLLLRRAREAFTNIEVRAQPIRILVPWKASLRSAGVARIAKSNRTYATRFCRTGRPFRLPASNSQPGFLLLGQHGQYSPVSPQSSSRLAR